MTSIITDSFHLTILILRCVGLYYNGKQSLAMKIWKYSVYLLSVVMVVLALFNLFVEENIDMLQLNQLVVFLAEASSGVVKILLFMKNGSRIKKCIHFFGDRRFEPKNEEEKRILDECVRLCRRNVKIIVGALAFTDVIWNILPLWNPASALPVKIWLPFELIPGSPTLYLARFYVAIGECQTYLTVHLCFFFL